MSEQLFIKLMMMTTSTHDGEVLTAIRKANAILAGQNLNWEEFIMQMAQESVQFRAGFAPEPATDDGWTDVRGSGKPKRKPSKPAPGVNTYGGPGVDQMFNKLLGGEFYLSGSFALFVEDVKEFYDRTGYLTQKQYDAISKAYSMRRGR